MLKHLRRTVVIVCAIALSVAVMLFVESLLTGLRDSFFTNLFQDSGHVQIHGEGYADRLEPHTIAYLIEDPNAVVALLSEDPRVRIADALLPFGGLLIGGEKNIPTGAVGLRPGSSFYGNVRSGLVEGALPTSSDQIVVSVRTADLLDLSLGGSAILLVQDSTGSPYYGEFTVSGLFATESTDFDTSHVFVTHGAAEDLLYLPEETVEIRALLEDPSLAEAFAADIRPALEDRGLEVATWRGVHGSFVVAFGLFDVFMLFIDAVVIIVASTVIANAILMTVFERSTEFGTLRAIGMKKRQQAWMIMTEGALEGAAGGVVGLSVGVPLVLWLAARGIAIGEFSESFNLGSRIFPSLTAALAVRSFLAGVVIAVASSGYVTLVSARRSILALLAEA